MKVFVTGGSGLVGSTIIDLLLARGDTILAIDNFATGRRDNLTAHPRFTLVEDSIVNGELAPGRNDEYLFYQVLLGAWPFDPSPEDYWCRMRMLRARSRQML